MRKRLILVFVAISTLVATAFVVPLGFVVRQTAEDRAIDAARADTAAIVPFLVSETSRSEIERVIATTASGAAGRMTVITSQGWIIGSEGIDSDRVRAALRSGASSIGDVDGGAEVVAAVASGPGELSAIRVFVGDDIRRKGQARAWLVLGTVGFVLVGISVLVADRLARSVVSPTRRLAVAARRLGDGDLEATVEADGPEELAELAAAFNGLGARVSSMLENEREFVAELSHRLRTPLTKMRMRIDQVEDPVLANELRQDIDGVTEAVNELIAEARGLLVEQRICDLTSIASERAEFWKVLADDQGRPWTFRSDDSTLMVGALRVELAAAVDVLIENVFAHTSDEAAISLACREKNGIAEFVVADGGPGFDAAASQRGHSGVGSTGLGLDIARQLAAKLDGSFHIGPSQLGGAQVTLALPIISR